MEFTSSDKHKMQLDSKHVPTPVVNERRSSTFHIPVNLNLAYGFVLVA
jgi:hypothetical protein